MCSKSCASAARVRRVCEGGHRPHTAFTFQHRCLGGVGFVWLPFLCSVSEIDSSSFFMSKSCNLPLALNESIRIQLGTASARGVAARCYYRISVPIYRIALHLRKHMRKDVIGRRDRNSINQSASTSFFAAFQVDNRHPTFRHNQTKHPLRN